MRFQLLMEPHGTEGRRQCALAGAGDPLSRGPVSLLAQGPGHVCRHCPSPWQHGEGPFFLAAKDPVRLGRPVSQDTRLGHCGDTNEGH